MGRVLATKMFVVLEYSSQGANGVKENRPLLICILQLLIKCLARCLLTTRGRVHGTWPGGCALFLPPPGHLDSTGRGQGKGRSGNVKSQRLTCFTDDK